MARLVAATIWGAAVLFFRLKRINVLYFIWGATGLTLLLLALLRGSPLEHRLEHNTGVLLHNILTAAGVETAVFEQTPATGLILTENTNSWTVVEISLESSGLLEICVYIGLLLFYPGRGFRRRITAGAVGLAALFAANLLRLTVIGLMISKGGRGMIYVAHTLAGKVLFFCLTVIIYWYSFTGPSLYAIRGSVGDG